MLQLAYGHGSMCSIWFEQLCRLRSWWHWRRSLSLLWMRKVSSPAQETHCNVRYTHETPDAVTKCLINFKMHMFMQSLWEQAFAYQHIVNVFACSRDCNATQVLRRSQPSKKQLTSLLTKWTRPNLSDIVTAIWHLLVSRSLSGRMRASKCVSVPNQCSISHLVSIHLVEVSVLQYECNSKYHKHMQLLCFISSCSLCD